MATEEEIRKDVEIIMNICYPQGDWIDNQYVERKSWRACVEQLIDTFLGKIPKPEGKEDVR
jgi:hypothetical protein